LSLIFRKFSRKLHCYEADQIEETQPRKLLSRTTVHDLSNKLVLKLGVMLNTYGGKLWNDIQRICTHDCDVHKKVIKHNEPAPCFGGFANMEEFFYQRNAVEKGMPDLLLKIHSYRSYYSRKTGLLQIRCEYGYNGTFLHKAPLPEGFAYPCYFSSSGYSSLVTIPIRCKGTIFISLNQDHRISNLEFVVRYF
jgi:hypothetical protein